MLAEILVVTGIFPPDVGGVATVAVRLVEDLAALGYSVRVITFSEEAFIRGNVLAISRECSLVQRYLRLFFVLSRHTTSSSIVVVTDSISTGLPARMAQIVRRYRLVIRLGGERSWENAVESGRMFVTLREYWARGLGGWRQVLFAWYYRWFFAGAERLIFVSQLLQTCLTSVITLTRPPVIVPNTVETKARAVPPKLSSGTVRWLFVGRMVRVKNLAFFAQVVRRCEDEGQLFELVCLGDGPDEDCLKGLKPVRCLGSQPAAEVKRFMETADVLVLPSLTDIYPNAVVEALSYGLPVVMTTEHGLPEGYRGIRYCPPTDVEAWVKVLGELQNSQVLQDLRGEIALPETHGPSLAQIIHETATA